MAEIIPQYRFILFLLFLAGSVAAQDYMNLKATLFDHDYGDFNGEFSSSNVTGCFINSKNLVPGMVKDTLQYDSSLGKKIPRRGTVDACSKDMEKWFDPTQSVSSSCGNLFFKNVGQAGKPVWKLLDSLFFPMDSMSRQRTWEVPGVDTLADDFAYCMEVNTALTYRGGETLKFSGDDDLWVYLDNKLIVDQGGVHTARFTQTDLDTLAFLKTKSGKTLDLDIYFCSRQPATAVFGMEASAELKPVGIKSLQIVDSLGANVASKDIITGKTRLCARPYFQEPGAEQCGNYKIPPDLTFLSADWDLNGQTLSMVGGQACLDLDPSQFANNTRINITAKAEDHSSRISLTLVRLARPQSGTLSGNGRAERVTVKLDSAAGPAPEGLEMRFDFAGVNRYAWAHPDSADAWTLRGALGFDNTGPFGFTGFAPVPASTRQTVYTRISALSVNLRDGVTPVLTGARLHWGKGNGQPPYLEIRTSEPMALMGDSLAMNLAWKNREGDLPALAGPKGGRLQPDQYAFSLSEAAVRQLHPGDSVSLSPLAMDEEGNRAQPHFLAVLFPDNAAATVGPLRLRENPVHGAAFLPTAPVQALIPVSASGQPLGNLESERNWAAARGPVLEIPARVPITRIRLSFHDHLGAFVNAVERGFTDQDWESIRAASPGDTTWVRLMWYPVARNGARLGTGAYIVEGRIWTKDGALVTGPDGDKIPIKGESIPVRPRLFGYLRD